MENEVKEAAFKYNYITHAVYLLAERQQRKSKSILMDKCWQWVARVLTTTASRQTC